MYDKLKKNFLLGVGYLHCLTVSPHRLTINFKGEKLIIIQWGFRHSFNEVIKTDITNKG